MAKLAPITILTEPIGSILRLAELIERGDCSRSNRMESNGCRELDWLVQLRACGAFGVDCHVCVVRCSGSCRSRNGRGRLDSRVLAFGGGGVVGACIWSMHYIGMLAFILPIPVAYHWPTVLLSLFAAVLASVSR